MARNLSSWLELQNDLDAAPRPLGRPAGLALAGLQRAVAAPYRRLALWFPYTLIVFALAKALGGRAGLAEMLGATALSAVPHLLDLLRPLPWLGPIAALAGAAWGAAIYVRATAVSNGLGTAQALLAAALPALAALTAAMGALAILAVVW